MASTPKPVRQEIKKRTKSVKDLYSKDKKGEYKDPDVKASKMSKQEVRLDKKSAYKDVKKSVKKFK